MIKGVKIVRQFGENNRVTEFSYKGHVGGWLTEKFNNAAKVDFDAFAEEAMTLSNGWKEVDKHIATQRAAMTPEQRASQDEADRAVFERWQDEANTNTILDGYEPEKGEDLDFNPFRKDQS